MANEEDDDDDFEEDDWDEEDIIFLPSQIIWQSEPQIVCYADVWLHGRNKPFRCVVPSNDANVVNVFLSKKHPYYEKFVVLQRWVCDVTLVTEQHFKMKGPVLSSWEFHSYNEFSNPDAEPTLVDFLDSIGVKTRRYYRRKKAPLNRLALKK